ncbi:uncharacterized protein LOC119831887 [Zerene cesonia]|uniref:uncharacterized protein LOC119831887 n=1 Tax=Zerene cesonia TaxID=33412 RepID=UPI0018E56331|nr:uncharacterized protein LOC119831887 [Zerene cesonia]
MGTKWLILCSLWAARLVLQPTPPVVTTSGLLRGYVAPDGSHLRYNGIPYAIAERFQVSRPVSKWEGVFDAVNENVRCAQRFSQTWINGRENCLTLNVYTPLQAGKKPYPVMVFIHGGGFRDGSGSPLLYGPEYLTRHGVVLVTVNYRLEILGFLCLGIKEAPGNMGLKDQVEALRWVQRNIQAFGGDPDNVTLFGESAGSASVSYHIVSPMSRGLFHKAIMQSGSAMAPWALQFEPLPTARKLAKQMGHELNDAYDILELLNNKPVKDLLGTRVPRAFGDTVLSENIFVPCIENDIPNSEEFIRDSPYNLINKGQFNKVPIIMGYNSAEGLMFVGKENETTINNFSFIGSLPRDLKFPSEYDKNATAEKLKEIYFENFDKSTISPASLAKYEGDLGIVYPVILTADFLMRKMEKPVFIYKFSRDGWMNLLKLLFGVTEYPGATHADELFYIFKTEITLPMSFFEIDMTKKMTTMWTNFAKFDNPTPEATQQLPMIWQPSNKMDQKVLVIDTKFSTEPLWKDDAIIFLNQTYTKYRRKSYLMLFLFISLSSASLLRPPTLPVRVSGGTLRGSVALDGSHLRYTGIPYATAQRFQAPKPAPKWRGIFDAVNEHRRCPQNFPKPLITGDEDCLYLNVYTPLKSENKLYPVMVFIHGGGFKEGSGSPLVYGPEYLVKHDVILVTFNYRLGVLGFLCLGIKEAAGNMGLKDQVEALRWVKNNIRAFGGDPDNITLFGESAGSASVVYHMLSPMSTGLFNKAIMESGSAMSYWSGQFEPKEIAFKLAAHMGHNTRDVRKIVNIFKRKTITELLSAKLPRNTGDIVQSENIFVPCIEDTIEGLEPFITSSPYDIINSGNFNKVPVIMGFNNAEGYMFVGKETSRQRDEFKFISALPRDLIFPTASEKETTAERLKELYQDRPQMSIQSLVKYEGDAGIKYPVIATVDLLLKNMDEPVYVYKFAYDGLLNLVKFGFGFGTYPGASHGDELLYIFKPQGSTVLSLLEMNIIGKMTLMWTNFAKYGNPTPDETALVPMKWQPTNLSDPQLLVIDRQLSTESLWNDQDILFWNDTYTYYRRIA